MQGTVLTVPDANMQGTVLTVPDANMQGTVLTVPGHQKIEHWSWNKWA